MIKWTAIDDLMVGPKVLLIKAEYFYSLIIRPRPFWLRLKIWWTRGQIVRSAIDYIKSDAKLVVPPTLEIGRQ